MRRPVSLLLGLFGGGLGLLWAIGILISDGAGCSCRWTSVQMFFGWPMLVGSLLGFAGCAVFRSSQKIGGSCLLAASFLVSPLTLSIASRFLDQRSISYDLLFLAWVGIFFGPSLLAGFCLFLGGLLAVPLTRRFIKNLIRDISERYYGFLRT